MRRISHPEGRGPRCEPGAVARACPWVAWARCRRGSTQVVERVLSIRRQEVLVPTLVTRHVSKTRLTINEVNSTLRCPPLLPPSRQWSKRVRTRGRLWRRSLAHRTRTPRDLCGSIRVAKRLIDELATIVVIPCLGRLGLLFDIVHDLVKARAMPCGRTRSMVDVVIPSKVVLSSLPARW